MFYLITGTAIFIIGMVIGSFSNVCIYRIPRNESVVFPASHCPICSQTIKWYDNIPVISFLMLRGKCRNCKAKISVQYPMVEFLTGVVYLMIFLFYGLQFKSLVYMLFCSVLIIITFIDLKEEIIPDTLSLPFMAIGFLLSFFLKDLTPVNSLLGILVGGGSLLLIAAAGSYLFKREAMGGGDIKLAAMVGSFLGWQLTLLSLFLGFFFGAVAGVLILRKKRINADNTENDEAENHQNHQVETVPFGPFIALGSLLALFFGEAILKWYFIL